jgi:CCR4-NOT transcriptional complex subunit CAF120
MQHLFFDRDMAESLDPRDDRTSAIRRDLKQVLIDRMYGPSPPPGPGSPQAGEPIAQGPGSQNQTPDQRGPSGAPMLPPIQGMGSGPALSAPTPQLPPLNFNGAKPPPPPQQQQQQPQLAVAVGAGLGMPPASRSVSSLSPITERSTVDTRGSSSMPPSQRGSGDPRAFSNSPPPFSSVVRPTPEKQGSQPAPERQVSKTSEGYFDGPMVKSPVEQSHSVPGMHRGSEDSYTGSRPDSKLAKSASYASTGFDTADSRAPSEKKSPPTMQSPSDIKSPSTVQSQYPPTPSTQTSLGALTPAVNSLPQSQTQGTLPSPRSASTTHSAASGSLHSPRVPSETSIPSGPEQLHAKSSPPPPIQIVSPALMPNPHSPVSEAPTSQAPSPPPKSDPATSATTPAMIRRDWPQPPQAAGTSPLPAQPKPPSNQEHDLASEAGAHFSSLPR